MRYLVYTCLLLIVSTAAFGATGASVTYQVNGQSYEGYYISPSDQAPFLLLIHDWDGLTDYEIKRANMLADLGYAVFALDLFGAGVRPTEVKDKRQPFCWIGAPASTWPPPGPPRTCTSGTRRKSPRATTRSPSPPTG